MLPRRFSQISSALIFMACFASRLNASRMAIGFCSTRTISALSTITTQRFESVITLFAYRHLASDFAGADDHNDVALQHVGQSDLFGNIVQRHASCVLALDLPAGKNEPTRLENDINLRASCCRAAKAGIDVVEVD